jgi:Holliday junction resolvase RusA-like endonuclease
MKLNDIPVSRMGRDFKKQMAKMRKTLHEEPDAINKPLAFSLSLPPSVNDMYYTRKATEVGKTPGRGLSDEAGKWKKDANHIAAMEALAKGWKLTRHSKVVVEITAYWPDSKQARDMNNLHKALADALEKAIYWNDSKALLRDMDYTVDVRRPRVELRIYQMEG